MNPRPTITPEEVRVLRREVHGTGNLARLGLITVTAKGREWIAQDDERVRTERAAGGKYGIRGGRPKTKGSI